MYVYSVRESEIDIAIAVAHRGARGARIVRATASAVGPGAARHGAGGARTVRATAAAMGPGGKRGGAEGRGGEGGLKCHQQ